MWSETNFAGILLFSVLVFKAKMIPVWRSNGILLRGCRIRKGVLTNTAYVSANREWRRKSTQEYECHNSYRGTGVMGSPAPTAELMAPFLPRPWTMDHGPRAMSYHALAHRLSILSSWPFKKINLLFERHRWLKLIHEYIALKSITFIVFDEIKKSEERI